jgi:uncharacterized protein YndB with AHSA1/START domain
MRWLLLLLVIVATPATAQQVATRIVAETDGSRTLVHETMVAAPAPTVWAAISTAEGWRSWAVPIAWMPEPDVIETSYARDAKPGDATTIRQHIVARIPDRLLVFTTVKAPDGFPHFESYAKVTSFFELEPVPAGGTRVRLTQTGYAPDDAGNRLLAFFQRGNAETLEKLRARFANGS